MKQWVNVQLWVFHGTARIIASVISIEIFCVCVCVLDATSAPLPSWLCRALITTRAPGEQYSYFEYRPGQPFLTFFQLVYFHFLYEMFLFSKWRSLRPVQGTVISEGRVDNVFIVTAFIIVYRPRGSLTALGVSARLYWSLQKFSLSVVTQAFLPHFTDDCCWCSVFASEWCSPGCWSLLPSAPAFCFPVLQSSTQTERHCCTPRL